MKDQLNLSEKIKIRPLQVEDFESVLLWSKDDTFCSANGWKLNRKPDDLFRWWLNCESKDTEDFIRLGIEYDGRLIGYADIACILHHTAEFGIAIGEPRLWGKGIGSYAALSVMKHATNNLGISTFNAETHETNTRSRKMLEKLGFVEMSRQGSEEYLGMDSQLIQYRLLVTEKA